MALPMAIQTLNQQSVTKAVRSMEASFHAPARKFPNTRQRCFFRVSRRWRADERPRELKLRRPPAIRGERASGGTGLAADTRM